MLDEDLGRVRRHVDRIIVRPAGEHEELVFVLAEPGGARWQDESPLLEEGRRRGRPGALVCVRLQGSEDDTLGREEREQVLRADGLLDPGDAPRVPSAVLRDHGLDRARELRSVEPAHVQVKEREPGAVDSPRRDRAVVSGRALGRGGVDREEPREQVERDALASVEDEEAVLELVALRVRRLEIAALAGDGSLLIQA